MVIHRKDMKVEEKTRMRDGDGVCRITHLVDAGSEPHARLLAELTLGPGCSIGPHDHQAETEYFFIISGQGVVNDNGVDVAVAPGDAVVTGRGASHAIRNTGDAPLRFHAVIVTDKE